MIVLLRYLFLCLFDSSRLTFLISKNKLGQDIEKFGNEVYNLAQQIYGYGNSQNNLSSIIAKCFIDCDIKSFCLIAICFYNIAYYEWDIIQ